MIPEMFPVCPFLAPRFTQAGRPLRRVWPTGPALLGLVAWLALAAVDEAGEAKAEASAGRPNVVLVITDDQGYGDLGCHGNPVVRTPELDRLHGESLRLTDYHVSPTCAPTRGALQSGRVTNRCGPWHTVMGRSMLFEGETTLGERFQAGGYRTGMFGKWHLGDHYPFRPEDRGFDEVVRHAGGGIGQTPDAWDNGYFDDVLIHNGQPWRFAGFCTDVFFREATRFMGEAAAAGAPFFALITPNAPHDPFHCPDRYWRPYLEKGVTPEEAIFFGMIANLDENIGRLRAWLKERGLAENTVFIFTTDNGTATGERVFNAGMRGKKASEYEGGHRVPFFLHWPGGGIRNGRDAGVLSAHVDVLPTLAEVCGLPLPAGYALDGRSLAPWLRGTPAEWPERTLITDSQRVYDPVKWKQSAVMTQRWRLINGRELYEIGPDPGQKRDVAAQFPEVVARLRADYETWWDGLAPARAKTALIRVGSAVEPRTVLNAHDWKMGDGLPPWHQGMIRAGQAGEGSWLLRADRAGRYQVELRRWPPETGAALGAGLPPGKPVEGLLAYRETPGEALDIRRAELATGPGPAQAQAVQAGQEAAVFEIDWPEGEVELRGSFILGDGRRVGAYYAVVEWVGGQP